MKQLKEMLKRSPDKLREYLQFKRRGFKVQSKKGRGSYTRKQKHKKNSF